MSAQLDLVISHLPAPPRKAPARAGAGITRAFRANCPYCQGHGLPLSLGETVDGRILLHCFTGCEVEQVLSSLGLTFGDVLHAQAARHHVRGNGGPSAWGALAAAVDSLRHLHARLLATVQLGDTEEQLREMLAAGEAMQRVQEMARRAMREGVKP